jgi:hypothetical protein
VLAVSVFLCFRLVSLVPVYLFLHLWLSICMLAFPAFLLMHISSSPLLSFLPLVTYVCFGYAEIISLSETCGGAQSIAVYRLPLSFLTFFSLLTWIYLVGILSLMYQGDLKKIWLFGFIFFCYVAKRRRGFSISHTGIQN